MRRPRGWHALGLFWAILLVGAGSGAALLQALGPVPHPAPLPEPPHAAAQSAPAPESHARVAPPDPALLEPSADFPPAQLPRVAADGRAPRTAYAAPPVAVPPGASRIALLVSGVGLSERDTDAAIHDLPGPVSLAVSAYANAGPATLEAARAAGHELFASIPMEPRDYPMNDEGPRALLTGAAPAQNRLNLLWALGRVPGAVGATGASDGMGGERFAVVGGAMDPMLDEIARRGLLYIDPRPGEAPSRAGLRDRSVDVVIDDPPARAEIEAKLQALERVARERGTALGLAGRPQPVTLQRLSAWIGTLQGRGFVLVPVSSLLADSVTPTSHTASQ